MEKHPITEPMRQATLQAMRTKGISQTQIAEVAGLGKPWVTKFLDGTTRLIREDVMHRIEELLGIKYHSYDAMSSDLSPLARSIAALVDADPKFAKLAASLQEAFASGERGAFTPRYVPTPEMTKIGKEIIRLVFANEDKPGKVAREVLKLLA
jgi:transcriptional regulator with XRE-family HTH domain